jgi:hypothetical protein
MTNTCEQSNTTAVGNSTQGNSILTQQIIPQFLNNTPNQNEPWGASMDIPDPSVTRIFFQNINGPQFLSPANRWQPHISTMKERGIAISVFAETNTNWNYQNIRSQITKQAREVFPNAVTSLSPNKYQPPVPSAYQPGGCLQICTSHWIGRITATISDPKATGRWVGHTYRLKESTTLWIITAYCPCRQTMSAFAQSVQTINKQQATLIFDATGETAEPRSIFMSDLIEMIQTLKKDPNHSCILMLNANARIDNSTDDLYKLLNATSLVDTFSMVTGTACHIPTYTRGK